MELVYNIVFFLIWIMFWSAVISIWAHFRYNNKEEIDKCFKERKEFKEKNEFLENKQKEYEEEIEKFKQEIEHNKREIAERNKYLSEDKVIIERLAQIKELSDNISSILLDYDKETIKHLLEEYKKKENENDDKKVWW